MTLKTKCGIAILAVAVVVALLPTPAMDAIYNFVYLESYSVAKWVFPIIAAVICYLLLSDWVKALIAGAVSLGITMFMFALMGIAGLDCASVGVPLSQACTDGGEPLAKIGLAGLICLNLFLLWRIAFPKPPKTPRAAQAK